MIAKLGAWFLSRLDNFFYAMGFFYNVLKSSLRFFRRKQVGYKVLTMQILFTGFEALKISAVIAVGVGAVIIIVGSSLLPQFGQSKLLYTILIVIITRELGPLLTAFVVIARSGTAMATELGSMVVSHEIEAYVSVGINPISYLVVPRFLGAVIAMVVLNLYFNIFGLMGSYIVAQLVKPLPFQEYFSNLIQTLHPKDIIVGLVKSFVFGVILSITATYQGFAVQRASTEVPVAGIKAVGQGFVFCILADAVITTINYA